MPFTTNQRFLAIAVAVNHSQGETITIEQEFYWDIEQLETFAQRLHDGFANEILPSHATIKEIIVLRNGDESDEDGRLFPTVVKKLRGNIDFVQRVFL